ncbi:MAG: hypothetical protein KDC61_08755 [Saprospiraceae bacterium]|nr:hypothetical protein [Saprospiraceae bacterium]MCB0574643.1 hypothetical protein [Saprospiraceae bacterium]MCB9353902.1 hypothetical protein [Lewinellaceae bacterium]
MKEVMLILHFIGLAMGLGTSLAFMFLGMASAKMEEAEARTFRMNTLALAKMGHIGLTLLVLTGLYLITPYWSVLGEMPLLIAKLVLVLVLGALIGIISATIKKVKNGVPGADISKVEPLGKLSLLTGLLIVILAVLSFH